MQPLLSLTTATLLLLSGTTLTLAYALPSNVIFTPRQTAASQVCAVDYTPQCCALNVLGVADVECGNPPTVPASTAEFVAECAAGGLQAQCCALDLLGVGLLCTGPL